MFVITRKILSIVIRDIVLFCPCMSVAGNISDRKIPRYLQYRDRRVHTGTGREALAAVRRKYFYSVLRTRDRSPLSTP